MTLIKKRLCLFVIVSCIVFAGSSAFCDIDTDVCGFTDCPGFAPPCYKVTFKDVHHMVGDKKCKSCVLHTALNHANGFILSKMESVPWCQWKNSGAPPALISDIFIEEDEEENLIVAVYSEQKFCGKGPHGTGSTSNDYFCMGFPGSCCGWDREYSCVHCEGHEMAWGGCDGWAKYEPVWDCDCSSTSVSLDRRDKDPNYGNLNCCPPGSGTECTIEMSCPDANFVIPEVTIEVDVPGGPGWTEVEVASTRLIEEVIVVPDECAGPDTSSVTFTIKAGMGKPPARARVTCKAVFLDTVACIGTKTETVMVKAGSGTCCTHPTAPGPPGGGPPGPPGGGSGGCPGPGCGSGGGGSPPRARTIP